MPLYQQKIENQARLTCKSMVDWDSAMSSGAQEVT